VGAFPPSGGRKRWAGINPQNPLDFAQSGFGFRPANTTDKKAHQEVLVCFLHIFIELL
jgi:hypothetical protein